MRDKAIDDGAAASAAQKGCLSKLFRIHKLCPEQEEKAERIICRESNGNHKQ